VSHRGDCRAGVVSKSSSSHRSPVGYFRQTEDRKHPTGHQIAGMCPLTKLPANPAAVQNSTISPAQPHPVAPDRKAGLSISRSTTPAKPISPPPSADTARPSGEIPPFVPGGTGVKVRTERGGEVERIPSSEARVSARQHERWLWGCQWEPSRLKDRTSLRPKRAKECSLVVGPSILTLAQRR
jgi:hypothetical protein